MGVLVREAIAGARAGGITVVLVTGRILAELRRVAGDLTFVDGVVAPSPDADARDARRHHSRRPRQIRPVAGR